MIIQQLQNEIALLKGQVQISIEQHETSVEEHKASNEELQAINEEFRSATEELETGKEELQALNEELQTVNQELKFKIEEVSNTNGDLQNLMNSTDLATIFLNRHMQLKRYTPRVARLFNVIPTDIERPLAHITHRLAYTDLVRDAEKVLRDLMPLAREIQSLDNDWYMVRILPYRTLEDHIDGVVLTFTDVTERHQSEERLRNAIAIETVGIIFFSPGGPITQANEAFLRMTGYSREDLASGLIRWDLMTPPEYLPVSKKALEELLTKGETIPYEKEYLRKDGTRWWGLFSARRLSETESVEFISDITERKRLQANTAFLAELGEELSHLPSTEEILKASGAKIGTFLNVAECSFFEIEDTSTRGVVLYRWQTSGMPQPKREYQLSELLGRVAGKGAVKKQLNLARAGQTIVVNNTFKDTGASTNSDHLLNPAGSRTEAVRAEAVRDAEAKYRTQAAIMVPFFQFGKWKYLLKVAVSHPRVWQNDEVSLVQELASRIFLRLDRARTQTALSESELRYRTLFNSIDEAYALCEIVLDSYGKPIDYRFLEVNPAFEQMTGITPGQP